MKNCNYQRVKTQITNHQPISKEDYQQLVALNAQYVHHIKKCKDTAEAMYFRTEQMEIKSLIEKAIIQETTKGDTNVA